MDRYARKRAWYRKTLTGARRAARRSDRWQGICGSPRRAEYETGRIEGQEAPAAGSAQRSRHVEAPKSGKTFKGAIQTTNAFDLSRVPGGYEPPPRDSSTPARPLISGGYHFGGCTCLKYLKSGGAWSFFVGIKNPSPLRKYASVPITPSLLTRNGF